MQEKTVWRPSGHESKLYWQVEESEAGNRVDFDSLGQNQRVFEAFGLILPRRPAMPSTHKAGLRKAG
jgi:hypothetical protein